MRSYTVINVYFLSLLLLLAAGCQSAPAPYGACPTPQQLAWQQMEMNLFCHFGPNTFTGAECRTGRYLLPYGPGLPPVDGHSTGCGF